MTTMKRMLNRMLRYADAIVKRGVDKLISKFFKIKPKQQKPLLRRKNTVR